MHKSFWPLFLCVIFAVSLPAQDPTGNLEGRVLDRNGDPISGASATVRNLQNGHTRSQPADATGYFR
ncbi:MAG TPA: carboxypeptidase-like regulatory domain-containing protein, partial [Bryobacteraceae bacterium]|nr:carboxypeptidase-like regulatory domain-containing protein [Bryobacteraceae bacterium]